MEETTTKLLLGPFQREILIQLLKVHLGFESGPVLSTGEAQVAFGRILMKLQEPRVYQIGREEAVE